MKKHILSFVVAIFFGLSLNAQQQGVCLTPMGNVAFQQSLRTITSITNPAQRLSKATAIVRSNCLSTIQVGEVMRLFNNDDQKLSIASSSLNAITDYGNVYFLMDEFAHFSTAFMFYDQLMRGTPPVTQVPVPIVEPLVVVPPPAPAPVMTFPVLNYPAVNMYSGPRNCDAYLAESDFIVFAQDIFNRQGENLRMDASLSLVSRTCLSVAQAMKISTLLSLENNRMEFLKAAYSRIFDEANYDQAQQVFNHQPNKFAFAEFLKAKRLAALPPAPIVQPPAPCVVSSEQFRMLRETLAREGSSSSRVVIAKNQIPAMKCFSSQQMKEILNLYPSSSDRLDVAKFAFQYVTDKDNYFLTVSSLFNSSSDRENLSNFVASQPR
jgi:Domain of unknown function (DUF4476)